MVRDRFLLACVQAYKSLAMRFHPDKNPQNKAAAEVCFRKVRAALFSAEKQSEAYVGSTRQIAVDSEEEEEEQ